MTPFKKVKKSDPIRKTIKHTRARLEDLATKNWISHSTLLKVASEEFGRPVKLLTELTESELRTMEEIVKLKGWKMRE